MPCWRCSAHPTASTARRIRRWPPPAPSPSRLESEVPECPAGIGVAAGNAVAGNVGAKERFEYTVIGEPVNEAARLCELAKDEPGRLLASSDTVNAASESERARWSLGETVTLRGHGQPTRLAAPV